MEPGGLLNSFSVDEMRFAIAVFESAALMKTPRPVRVRDAALVNEQGKIVAYRVGDDRLWRGITAVIDHYKEQKLPPEDRHSIAWRILLIPDLAAHPACGDRIRQTETKLELDDAVVETLASYPVRLDVEVSIEDFFRQVELTAGAMHKAG